MKKTDDEAELISDWKFAAMVVDRFVTSLQYIHIYAVDGRTFTQSQYLLQLIVADANVYNRVLSFRLVCILPNLRSSPCQHNWTG